MFSQNNYASMQTAIQVVQIEIQTRCSALLPFSTVLKGITNLNVNLNFFVMFSFTSLLQALMSSSKKTAGTQNAQLTDGIDIKTWTVKSEDGLDITFSAWDFAGQTVYYNTHQVY